MWNFPLLPDRASTVAGQVDALYYFLVSVSLFFSLVIVIGLVSSAIRYRKGSKSSRAGAKNDHLPLELIWTLTPLTIAFVIFAWSAKLFVDMRVAPPDAMEIYVVGKQWMWKIQHPEGNREINELHVPVGKPVKLIMTSQDVIHSFFIPEFRIKQDVLPGRYSTEWFQATKAGTYHLFCAEYCGTSHAGMVGVIVVMEPADYERWLHSSAEGSLALQGRKTFLKYRCVSCHSADAEARAPILEGLFGRPVILSDGRVVTADENYIRESILYPSAKIAAGWENIMPTFKGETDEEDIIGLIAYIQSLKPGETPKRVETYPPPTSTPPIEDTEPETPKDR